MRATKAPQSGLVGPLPFDRLGQFVGYSAEGIVICFGSTRQDGPDAGAGRHEPNREGQHARE